MINFYKGMFMCKDALIIIRKRLEFMPKFVVEKTIEYSRAVFDSDLLKQVLFDEERLSDKLTIDELRKIDLSGVDFTMKNIEHVNLSYTNVNIDPQTVKYKSLRFADLEGLDLRGKDFKDVAIRGTNLKNTGALISLKDLQADWDEYENSCFLWDATLDNTDLTGCYLKRSGFTFSPLIAKIMYSNCKIVDDDFEPRQKSIRK